MNILLIAIILIIAAPFVSGRLKMVNDARRRVLLVLGAIVLGIPLLMLLVSYFRWGLLTAIFAALILLMFYPSVSDDFKKVAKEYGRREDLVWIYGTLFFLGIYSFIALLGELYLYSIRPFAGGGVLQSIVRELIFIVVARQMCRIAVAWLKMTWKKS